MRLWLVALLSFLFAGGSFAAEKAQLAQPAAGTVLATDAVRFVWTPVTGALYYVYVGSNVGTSDLADSGELTATEFVAQDLPGAVTIYVRLWTKAGGAWTYNDYSFSTSGVSSLVLPVPDSHGVIPPTAEFRWTRVSNAGAYYLYIGRSVGAKDIVDSGETLALSRVVSSLPEGERIFVRLWTKVGVQWYFKDYQFDTQLLRAKLITPAPSTLEADPQQTFVWSAVPDAQAYYLYVGRTAGASDVINSGELSLTNFKGPLLDGATRYYVRLYTKVAGAWRFRDYEFRTAPIARVIAPTLPGSGIVPGIEFSWSRVQGDVKYYLYVGSSPGLKDIVDTGELAATSFRPTTLPGGETLHARLWTKYEGRWRYVDESFTTAPVPSFITPRLGALGVSQSLTFRWTRVRNADAYRVELGTTPHGAELFDSGLLDSTSLGPIVVSQLPAIYGRVWARSGGVWRKGAVVFSTAPTVAPTTLTHPAPAATYSAQSGFRWNGNPLAKSYRLLVGTAPGGSEVHDSGPLGSVRHFVDTLTPGVAYHATLVTNYWPGPTQSTSIQFVGAAAEVSFDAKFEAVTDAAAAVAAMAADNFPAAASVLETVTRLRNRYEANCADYSNALLALLRDMNVEVPARLVYTSLVPNAYDTHTLVEVQDADTNRWALVDPTFGVVPRREFDGQPATSAEMSAIAILCVKSHALSRTAAPI